MTPSARSLLVALSLPLAFGVGCTLFTSPAAAPAVEDRAAGLWDWCPPAEPVSEIDEERLWLQFGEGALYCTVAMPSWDSSVSAWSQLEDKAQLRLVPGDNFLPREAGEHDVTLPVCARTAEAEAPSEREPGRLLVDKTEQLGRTRLDVSYLQTVRDPSGQPRTAYLRVSGYEDDLGPGILLDGSSWPLPDPDVHLALCDGESCAPDEDRLAFDACRYFDGPRELHELRFDGGEVRFVLENKLGASPPRMHLTSAAGSLETLPFEQVSFWSLVGRESWPWSGGRDIAVVFDAPVGDICGLTATQLYDGSTNGSVELRRCDGTTQTRLVLSHTVALENVEEEDGGEGPP